MKSNTFTLIDKKIFVIGNYIILMESHWYLNLSETINLVCFIRKKILHLLIIAVYTYLYFVF